MENEQNQPIPECTEDKRICVIIQETVKIDGEYSPCIVVEGELGYHRTDWKWGTDLKEAEKIADEYNEKRGIDKRTAIEIVLKSMKN